VRVLLTGAFGHIGRETLRELRTAGHQVRAFDLMTRQAHQQAAGLAGRIDVRWGDVTDAESVARAVADCQAVIHDAAILPPSSERDPEATRRVNVEGTRNVVKACEAASPKPRLVFASSVTLFGPSAGLERPRRVDDPIRPTDHYTHSKAAGEEMVRASGLDWVILRFAAAPPEAPDGGSGLDLEHFFRLAPETRLEYLHPSDAGLAQARAIRCDEAIGRVLLIGGGESCQITLGELNDAYLEASGVGAFPRSAYGSEPYYTDWMDTGESQRLLGYQRHGFEHFREAVAQRRRGLRPVVRLLRAPVRWWMLRHSPNR
jgi:nucleoside-diphosphate-sugar epimerase